MGPFAWTVFCVASYALGTLVLGRRPLDSDAGRRAARWCVGVCLWAYVVLLAGSTVGLGRLVVWCLAGAQLAVAVAFVAVRRHALWCRLRQLCRWQRPRESGVLWGLLVALAGLHLVMCLAPAADTDSLRVHLAIPAQYLRAGSTAVVLDGYEQQPGLVWMQYVLLLGAGGETCTQLLSWSWGLAGALALFALGDRVGGRRVGLLSLAVYYGMHFATYKLHRTGNDLQYVVLVLTAGVALSEWWSGLRPRRLALVGLFIGLACATKLLALLTVPVFAVAVALRMGKHKLQFKSVLKQSALGTIALLIAWGAWPIRAWRTTGDPVYPLLASHFRLKEPYAGIQHSIQVSRQTWTDAEVSRWDVSMTSRLLKWPLDLTFGNVANTHWWSRGWSQGVSPLWLACAPLWLLLGKESRPAWPCLVLGLLLALVARTLSPLIRYQEAAFPFLTVATAFAVEVSCRRSLAWRRILPSAVLVCLAGNVGLAAAETVSKVPVIAGKQTRDDFLARRHDDADAFAWLRDHAAQGDRTLYYGITGYLCTTHYTKAVTWGRVPMPPFDVALTKAECLDEALTRGAFRWLAVSGATVDRWPPTLRRQFAQTIRELAGRGRLVLRHEARETRVFGVDSRVHGVLEGEPT